MEYLLPFIFGVASGFLMSVLLGAIFFMLIQTGINHHYKKAYIIASGVITGDILFVILAIGFTGAITVFLQVHAADTFILGGVVLVGFGIATIIKKRKQINPKVSGLKSARDFYFKPFLINLLNPANAAWWLGLYSIPPALNYQLNQKILFAAGAILTVFFTEIGVAYSASKLKKFITPTIVHKLDRIVGWSFILIGARLLALGIGWI